MPVKKMLITGAKGQVGLEVVRRAPDYGFTPIGLSRADLDITDADKLTRAVKDMAPDILVNCAAYTQVDKAETDTGRAFMVNATGPKNLALVCQALDIPLLHISTDYVFDGRSSELYLETDRANPVNIYGSTKLAGEQAVAQNCDKYIILRTSWVYGTKGDNFIKTMLALAQNNGQKNDPICVVSDQFGSPTFAGDIATTLLEIAKFCQARKQTPSGIYHYSGAGLTSWHGFAKLVFAELEAHTNIQTRLKTIATKDYPTPAQRPPHTALDTSKISNVFNISPKDWQQRVIEVSREIIKQTI